jgi:hypothetical protein
MEDNYLCSFLELNKHQVVPRYIMGILRFYPYFEPQL